MNRSEVVIYGSAVAYFAESMAFLIKPFEFSANIIRLAYPPSEALNAYCVEHDCLYSPGSVSSLYALQAITFLAIIMSLAVIALRHSRRHVDQTIVPFCTIVVVGAAFDYIVGNFSFDPIWIFSNSVTHSPAGLFRYAVLFWLATVASLIMSNIISPGEPRNAPR